MFEGNTFYKVSAVATSLTLTSPDAADWRVGPNTFSGGATATYTGGAGTRKEAYGTAAPASGTWSVGDIQWNTAVTSGSGGSPRVGWVCTTAGTPGTWTQFGGQGAAVSDSVAADVATLKTDFNGLLASLRASGIIAT